LHDVLETATRSRERVRVAVLRAAVRSASPANGQWTIFLAEGGPLVADILVLATGNEPPVSVAPKASEEALPFLIDDPWNEKLKRQIPSEATVLLIGTGLTAMDIVLELLERGHTGRIIGLSRRGLLPRVHVQTAPVACGIAPPYPDKARELLRRVREATDQPNCSWQSAVDALRPIVPQLWGALTVAERRRFFRHLRGIWNVHRHRMAPGVGAQIAEAQKRGQFQLVKGTVRAIRTDPSGRGLDVTAEAGHRLQKLEAGWTINCTGPCEDQIRTRNPLLLNLLIHRLVRPDPLRLGFDVVEPGRVIGANCETYPNLFALGPLTKGLWWEITAIPELRAQATRIAQSIVASAANGLSRPHQLLP